jgi:tRNA modification GTPase
MNGRATIVALASGRPPSAIAIVRVSGSDAFTVGRALCGALPRQRTAALRTLRRADRTAIDRAIVLTFHRPTSATGEDVVEFHIHGGQAVIAATIEAVLAVPGVRMAEPGEFTRRAFDTGKLDLTQVEGLADLLSATTEAQRAQAMAASGGALASIAATWRGALLNEMIEIEARIDFGDESDVVVVPHAPGPLRAILGEMLVALKGAQAAERVREGLTVVLLGPPNAGKSSLLNALVGRSAAIVAPQPGTTRDPIEVELDLGGVLVRVIDTAGIRDSSDPVESEGIARALVRAERADLVLGIGQDSDHGWRVQTYIDLTGETGGEQGGVSSVSSVTGEGIAELKARIAHWAHSYVFGESAVVINARQTAAVVEASRYVEAAAQEDEEALRAESLRLAMRALGKLSGTVDVEDVLSGIFARFCIGK